MTNSSQSSELTDTDHRQIRCVISAALRITLSLSSSRIDGTTSAADRQKSVADFNHPKCSTFIFLISTRAGGLGINLPSADTVIIYDPDFNPFVDIQAQARAHRIGQEKLVLVYQLVTECSVEEKILERSKKKLAMENLVMNSGLKGPNQTKDTAADISTVLLHGLNHVLDEQHVKASCTEHTTESVQKLLDRSISGSSLGENDGHGYLGAVQGHDCIVQDASKLAEDYVQGGYGEKWRELLSKLVEQDEKEELGRGKRTRKQVKYSVQENEDGQDDDEYTPTSSSDESGSDVSLEAEGPKSSSMPRKTADLVLEVGQEEEASRRRKSSGSSVPKAEVTGRTLPTFPTTSAGPVIISPSLHQGSTPGGLGTFSAPIYRQTEIAGSPRFIGSPPPTQMTGSYIPISGAIYERVISSQGIGIHLNRLIPAARGNVAVQAVVPPLSPVNNRAVSGYAGLSIGHNSVLVAGQVPTPIMNSTAHGNFGLRRGGGPVQFAGRPATSGINNAVRRSSGLPAGDKSAQAANPLPTLGTNRVIIGRSGTPGRGKSVQAAGSAPTPVIQSAQFGYSSSPGDKSVQGARPPPTPYVPPSPTPFVNIAVLGSSGISGQYQSAHLARPPPTPSYVAPPPPTSCVISAGLGHPGISANNVQGTFAGLHSPQFSSNVNSPATYTTRTPILSVPSPNKVATNLTQPPVPQVRVTNMVASPTQPPVPQVPVTDLVTPPTRLVLSSAGLKKSARNRRRHLQNTPETQVVATSNNLKPASAAAAPVLPAVPVVSPPPAGQASQAGSCVPVSYHPVVQLNPSENLSHVPALPSFEETAVPPLHSTPVRVSSETTQTMGTTVTGSQTGPSNPVGRVEEDATQQGLTKQTREPAVATNPPNPGGVVIPPIARAQAQRKPLWMPKGDAGLFMGSLRNI